MSLDPSAQLSRLEREIRFHKRLRELLLVFSQGVSSGFNLQNALETMVAEVKTLLEATRTSAWLHDRRERQLVLSATTDHAVETGERIATDDPEHPASHGMRMSGPHFMGAHLVVPLRGWRRALGALVIDGALAGPLDEHQLLEFADELGRQLAVGIENVQLIEEIVRQRRLLEDTFNSLVDLVAVVDQRLRIVQTNETFAVRVGIPRAELIDRPIADLVGPGTLASVDTQEGDRTAQTSGPVEDPRLGGTFLLTATPLVNPEGVVAGRVLVARDITRQTKLEGERAALRERLAQSEKLASLGQFVAGIAHEMNNPLQGVLGHLELLMETSADARPLKRQLKQIYTDADRAAKIVRNLLVFTGSRRMARRRLQVDRLVARALASRAASIRRRGIDVQRVQGENLPPVLGDPLLLQQALLNILINAEHAVADDHARPHPPRIVVTTETDDERRHVAISIHDNGRGIPVAVLSRIFDPFFTTKDVGKGIGLGLAITYGIVQEHGGTIVASNAEEGGAVFRIDLPAAEVVVK
jgi:two-component system NtrC family sensor kinase